MEKLQMVTEHLNQAERHVREGEVHLNRQRRIVRDLERDGHAMVAAQARKLLLEFEELQKMLIADRDRLSAEAVELEEPHTEPATSANG